MPAKATTVYRLASVSKPITVPLPVSRSRSALNNPIVRPIALAADSSMPFRRQKQGTGCLHDESRDVHQ
jgi:hypothetical protein